MNPYLLRPKEAAKSLAISERTLWELTNQGDLPCVRIGRSVRYDPVDLASWIQRQKSPRTSKGAFSGQVEGNNSQTNP
jgi:excisionase family DNA binding protein